MVSSSSSFSPPEQGVDDSRKKREYNKDEKHVGDSSGGEEKTKKIRPEAKHLSSWASWDSSTTTTTNAETTKDTEKEATSGWDLETALHRIFTCADTTDKEFLSADKWLTFRMGHAGDASTIASRYRKTLPLYENELSKEDGKNDEKDDKIKSCDDADALELRIATGMGDEDTPPAVFAIMVEIVSNEDAPTLQLGAVALLTLDWDLGQRLLRIEWFYVDQTLPEYDLVRRRLWLRLSVLALVTTCQLLLSPQVSG